MVHLLVVNGVLTPTIGKNIGKESNPRIGMLIRTWDKMDKDKQNKHLAIAEKYLAAL